MCDRLIEGKRFLNNLRSMALLLPLLLLLFLLLSFTECAKNSSCRIRLLFLDICEIVMAIFSRSFFKEHFFKAVLELGNVTSLHLSLSSFFLPHPLTLSPSLPPSLSHSLTHSFAHSLTYPPSTLPLSLPPLPLPPPSFPPSPRSTGPCH